jgi:phosphatidylserine/phosphatidylglycerophosphate/cardiolipin synthase-like enzyme
MIVDDRFFIIGSANLTNRSMTIDSEIVAAYEASPRDQALKNAIRRARVRLLLEHTGERVDVRALVRPEGLVARLDRLIDGGEIRLRHHPLGDEEPSLIAKTVHEVALEFLDPWDGATEESCPPSAA